MIRSESYSECEAVVLAHALLTFAGDVHNIAVDIFKATATPPPNNKGVLDPGPANVPDKLKTSGQLILGAVLWVVFALGVLGLLRSAAEVQIAWKDGSALGIGIVIRLCGIVVAVSAAPIVQFIV